MTKNYVFWRKATGEPDRKDLERHSPSVALKTIGQKATVQEQDKVSWPAFELDQQILILRSSVAVLDKEQRELNEHDTEEIVSRALRKTIIEAGSGQALRPTNFLKHANSLAAEFFRNKPRDFLLLTSISIEGFRPRSLQIDGATFSSVSKITGFELPSNLVHSQLDQRFREHFKRTKYLRLTVSTSGRSASEAFDQAMESANLLRGLWSIVSQFRARTIRLSARTAEPLGVIHKGAIDTLHNLDKSKATDFFWFEPHYIEDRKLFSPKHGWKWLEGQRRKITRKLLRNPLKNVASKLVSRYIDALDNANLDVTFVQLWSLLEKITDTVGSNYDETIRRAAWIYADRNQIKEQLDCVRMRRNRFIHSATSGEEVDQATYLLKDVVDLHLLKILVNDFGFASLEEYGHLLSLPTDFETLKKKRRYLDRAIKIHKPANTNPPKQDVDTAN